jgi:hypothetical protein
MLYNEYHERKESVDSSHVSIRAVGWSPFGARESIRTNSVPDSHHCLISFSFVVAVDRVS